MLTKFLFNSEKQRKRFSLFSLSFLALNYSLPFNVLADSNEATETIIVTGEKIDKDIIDTSNAVTVINEDQYASGEEKDINELVKLVPNVTTGSFGTVNIRGVNGSGPALGSNAFMTNGNPRVATTVDGVSEAWGGYNFNPSFLWDAQQVEIMRGPQSTSQGANSIGGAMVMQTNDPTQDWEFALRGGIESYDNGNMENSQAIMVSGPLVQDELAFRIAVDRIGGDSWVTYDEADDELDGAPDLEGVDSITARAKLLWTPNDDLAAKLTLVHRKNDGAYLNWVDIGSKDTLTLDDENGANTRIQDSYVNSVSLDVSYQFNSKLSNQLLLSYNDYKASFEEYPGNTLLDVTETKFTFEDRLIYQPADANLSGFVGAYIATSDSTLDVNFGSSLDAYDGDTTKVTSALFGEATYDINQEWAVTAGARVQHESQDRYLDAWDNILDNTVDETVFLPKLELLYSLTASNKLGASVRKGYNPGGNALEWSSWDYYTFDSETVIAYELSSKNRVGNGGLINANLFYNDYSDYQAYTNYRLENVDKTYTYGAEVEAQYFASDTLELRGSAGLLQSKVTSTTEDDWKDNELPFAADINLSAGFTQYITEDLSFGADATYVSDYYSDLENTESEKAGGYTTVDARMQYLWKDITFDAYITNLTNEQVVYQVLGDQAAAGRSRTIGLSATYRM